MLILFHNETIILPGIKKKIVPEEKALLILQESDQKSYKTAN
jgi:hypothetical protein